MNTPLGVVEVVDILLNVGEWFSLGGTVEKNSSRRIVAGLLGRYSYATPGANHDHRRLDTSQNPGPVIVSDSIAIRER